MLTTKHEIMCCMQCR